MNIVEQVWRKSEEIQQLKQELLRVIEINQPISFFDLVENMHLAYRNTLFFIEMFGREKRISKTKEGICLLNSSLKDTIYPREKQLIGKKIPLQSEIKHIAPYFNEIAKKRPSPVLLFGHRGITTESTLHRINYMLYHDDVVDKEMAFIGDNDLCSIALGLIGTPKRLSVFEIDEQLIEFLNAVIKKYKLIVEVYNYDCYDPVPPQFQKSFDIFWSDPYPTTDASFEFLFWSRGLFLLRPGAGQVGYTLSAPSHKCRSHTLSSQRLLIDMGLVITDIIPRYNCYEILPGELTPQEDVWLQTWVSNNKVNKAIAHTKSLIRFETTDGRIAHRDDSAILKNMKENLGNWIHNQCDNYLLLQMGVKDQIALAEKSLTSNTLWQEALSAIPRVSPLPNTLKLDIKPFYREITNRRITNERFIHTANTNPELIMEQASKNNYTVTIDEIQILKHLCVGIYEIPQQIDNNLFFDLYALIRHFESYYR